MPTEKSVRILVRAIDKLTPKLERLRRAFLIFAWWRDWHYCYGRPDHVLELVEWRWAA